MTDTDREFDLLVLGGGTGNVVVAQAAAEGLDVGLVEKGPLGGTCLNRGCNPSKGLIHRADVVEMVRRAERVGVSASVDGVAFADIVDDVNEGVTEIAEEKERTARERDNVTLYREEGAFVDERTVEVGGERVAGERVIVAGGSRPLVPDAIDGTDDVDFLTSDEALRLRERPDAIVIVGGGYIAAEMGHFFGTLGADVTIVGRAETLLAPEDDDIAERFTAAYDERYDLRLGHEVTALAESDGTVTVRAEDDGEEVEVTAEEVLLATGRRPNSDRWNVEVGGIETDGKGFVETDEYLETSADGVWAIGDIAGNYMFKHSGDKEAEYVLRNAVGGERRAVEYPGMAHVVFGSPQVAALGTTEAELAEAGRDYSAGTCKYDDTALGSTLATDVGYAKALVGDGGEILGCHIVGPHASMLIHEVSTAVAAGASAEALAETIHVHPALSEVVQGAFRDAVGLSVSGL